MNFNCCFGNPAAYAPIDSTFTTDKFAGSSSSTSTSTLTSISPAPAPRNLGFPGSRRFTTGITSYESRNNATATTAGTRTGTGTKNNLVRSAGNALVEYDPDTMSDLVRVTVPEGCWCGQVIQVNAPSTPGDGDGVSGSITPPSSTHVRIPFGCKPGSSFLVRIPSPNINTHDGINTGVMPMTTTTTTMMNVHDASPKDQFADHDLYLMEEESTNRNIEEEGVITKTNTNGGEEEQFQMLVKVPQGVGPGTTIHVLTPNDQNRFLPVIIPVPDGDSFSTQIQFPVTYTMKDTFVRGDMFGNAQTKAKENANLNANERDKNQKYNWQDDMVAPNLAPLVVFHEYDHTFDNHKMDVQ